MVSATLQTNRTVVSPMPTSKQRRPPPSSAPTRLREKQERLHLRTTVETLTHKLEEIKRDRQRHSPTSLSQPEPSVKQLVSAWEELAHAQCEQRIRAEIKNAKLRKLLQDQAKVTQTLGRMLSKRRGSEVLIDAPHARKRSKLSGRNPVDYPSVHAELDALLPSLYAQTDAAFSQECFHARDRAFRTVDVCHELAAGVYAEANELRLLPFAEQDCVEAIWRYLKLYPDGSVPHPLVRESGAEQDLIVRDLHVGLTLDRFAGQMHVKFVSRRFVEPTRVVIVWVALIDPSHVSGYPLDRACLRDTGWMCVQRSPLARELSEVLSTNISVPEFYDDPSESKQRSRARSRSGVTLSNYLAASLNQKLDGFAQSVDNRLLERALAHKATSSVTMV